MLLRNNNNNDVLEIYKPHTMQAEHEEADTLKVSISCNQGNYLPSFSAIK